MCYEYTIELIIPSIPKHTVKSPKKMANDDINTRSYMLRSYEGRPHFSIQKPRESWGIQGHSWIFFWIVIPQNISFHVLTPQKKSLENHWNCTPKEAAICHLPGPCRRPWR